MKGLLRLVPMTAEEMAVGNKAIAINDAPRYLAIFTIKNTMGLKLAWLKIIVEYCLAPGSLNCLFDPKSVTGEMPLKQSDWTKVIALNLIDKEVDFIIGCVNCANHGCIEQCHPDKIKIATLCETHLPTDKTTCQIGELVINILNGKKYTFSKDHAPQLHIPVRLIVKEPIIYTEAEAMSLAQRAMLDRSVVDTWLNWWNKNKKQ